MKKVDLRVKKTYKQLLDAFLILMSEKSFEELSVSEICDKAEVHRATFYKHFKDKNEFLNFCFESYLSQIGFKASEITTPTAQNIKESFRVFIVQVFEYIKENKLIFKIICSNNCGYSLGTSFKNAVNSFIFERVKQIIPDATEAKAYIFATFYSSALIGLVEWYAVNGDSDDLQDIYSFLEARVDELCATYIQKYI